MRVLTLILLGMALQSRASSCGIYCYECEDCNELLDLSFVKWCSADPEPARELRSLFSDLTSTASTRFRPVTADVRQPTPIMESVSVPSIQATVTFSSTLSTTEESIKDTTSWPTTVSSIGTTLFSSVISTGSTTVSSTESLPQTTDTSLTSDTAQSTDVSNTYSTEEYTTETLPETTLTTTTGSIGTSSSGPTSPGPLTSMIPTTLTTPALTTLSTPTAPAPATSMIPPTGTTYTTTTPSHTTIWDTTTSSTTAKPMTSTTTKPTKTTYHCYTTKRTCTNGKYVVNRGCIAVPVELGACDMLTEKYGDLKSCKICTNDRCNGGTFLRMSIYLLTLTLVFPKLLQL